MSWCFGRQMEPALEKEQNLHIKNLAFSDISRRTSCPGNHSCAWMAPLSSCWLTTFYLFFSLFCPFFFLCPFISPFFLFLSHSFFLFFRRPFCDPGPKAPQDMSLRIGKASRKKTVVDSPYTVRDEFQLLRCPGWSTIWRRAGRTGGGKIKQTKQNPCNHFKSKGIFYEVCLTCLRWILTQAKIHRGLVVVCSLQLQKDPGWDLHRAKGFYWCLFFYSSTKMATNFTGWAQSF